MMPYPEHLLYWAGKYLANEWSKLQERRWCVSQRLLVQKSMVYSVDRLNLWGEYWEVVETFKCGSSGGKGLFNLVESRMDESHPGPSYLCPVPRLLGADVHCSTPSASIGTCELKPIFPPWSCSCICQSTLACTQITWKAVSTPNPAQMFTVTLFKWRQLELSPSSDDINLSCL